jgi:DNA-binding NarL/FixJ family response regulator
MSDMLALELMNKLRAPKRKVRKQKPAFVVFDRPDRPRYIKRSLDGGAISYSSICDCQEEIVRTVRAAACGKRYLSPTVVSGFANSQLNQVELTPRQMEVLLLLACGCENKFIASLLSVRNQSVKNVVSEIFARRGVTSRTGAAIEALLDGQLSPTEIERVRRRLEMLDV